MKLPRDLSGAQLIEALDGLGYQATRQAGSYVRLTSFTRFPIFAVQARYEDGLADLDVIMRHFGGYGTARKRKEKLHAIR
ncbi:MAG: hypothetical protein ACYCTW_00580 [Sulfuricella sp.]